MAGSERKVLSLPKAIVVLILVTGSTIGSEACKKSCDANAGGGAESGQGGEGGEGGRAVDADNCRT
jgi:hypothetical protein